MPEQDRRENVSQRHGATPRDAQKGGQGAIGKEHSDIALDQEGDKKRAEHKPTR